jgi:hypothetical protein
MTGCNTVNEPVFYICEQYDLLQQYNIRFANAGFSAD